MILAETSEDDFTVNLLVRKRIVLHSSLRVAALREASEEADLPLVSALMVTRDRAPRSRCAVECYRRQTYPRRELVIVDDGRSDELERAIRDLDDPSIRIIRLTDEGHTLGELRNLAIERAAGEFVAQWDDDDLCDPRRLEVQMAAILALCADASFLERWRIWWPAARRLVDSRPRVWEGSLVATRDAIGAYPPLRRGEDTPVVAELLRRHRVALVDAPHLYVYVRHDVNTFGVEHFEAHWRLASRRYEGRDYEREIETLRDRMPLGAYLEATGT
jgi:glycosyltransferase involved in cell wall biosynthesis